MMITSSTATPLELVRMAINNQAAYDPVWRIVLKTTNGRTKRGNKRRYFVLHIVDEFNPYTGKYQNAPRVICEFRAANDEEAVVKLCADKRVDAFYAHLWQREMQALIGEG